ncbi:transglycosylase [Aquaspirillum sp. LM1]|uniref:murein transglycosylase A n=1 Tax=Aquaspirillum sp. LM1 TaxID=1938604 RepID=UPI0009839AEA|nr:murein transglycosylase A [Aquaspirillum sp. LM1]AQR65140.1 transglycosylase [Aquaspirillum sp. LM1]
MTLRSILSLCATLVLAACVTAPPPPPARPPVTPTPTPPVTPTPSTPPRPTGPVVKAPVPASDADAKYIPVTWAALPGWNVANLAEGFSAFSESCKALGKRAGWRASCDAAAQVDARQPDAVRQFYQTRFTPYRLSDGDKLQGLVTGYYEPLLRGDSQRSARGRYPIYAPPADLLTVDLASIYPELKNLRLRGRVQGNKVVPYWTRSEIEVGRGVERAEVLAWVEDPIELFFLQVQGSGRVELANGELMRVGYADQNGFPYKSIGKWLIDKGELTAGQATMQGIQAWAQANPARLAELLNSNPSYVFFRRLNNTQGGPLGALGVPLTDGYSIAVDPRYTPLGAPVWLSTSYPMSNQPLQRLMYAQDTGGAIRGAVRADFFWGFGREAGEQAGRMKQTGEMWIILPKGMTPAQAMAGGR